MPSTIPDNPTCLISEDPFLSPFKPLLSSALKANGKLFFSTPMLWKPDGNSSSVRSGTLCCRLPNNLPPSIRGRLIKIAYKVLIVVRIQKDTNSQVSVHLLQLPFRVLPPLPLLRSLHVNEKTEAVYSHSIAPTRADADNPFWIHKSSNVYNFTSSPLGQGVASKDNVGSSSDLKVGAIGLTCLGNDNLPETVASSFLSTSHDNVSVDQNGLNADVGALSLPSYTVHPANFVISCAHGHVTRFCLLRTLFSPGDVIHGYFNFSNSQVSCLACTVSLQSEELCCVRPDETLVDVKPQRPDSLLLTSFPLEQYSEPERLTPIATVSTDQTITWCEMDLPCLGYQLLPLSCAIPHHVTPQFFLCAKPPSQLALLFRWRLHFEFRLVPKSSPVVNKQERFSWTLPIHLVSHLPASDPPGSLLLQKI
ncbi:unnamed protein product [Dicrocoelium dendriticum]|nr:unnamed protein product [Dicrocoelium dendriticum]